MTPTGRRPARRAAWTPASRDAGSRLKVSPWTSTNTGTAPRKGTTSAVAAKVKAGIRIASPGRTSNAMSASARASVPLAQATVCGAPQNAERLASSSATSGPMMYCPCARTRARAASSRSLIRACWVSRSMNRISAAVSAHLADAASMVRTLARAGFMARTRTGRCRCHAPAGAAPGCSRPAVHPWACPGRSRASPPSADSRLGRRDHSGRIPAPPPPYPKGSGRC